VLLPAIQRGEIKEKDLDEKVARILRLCFSYGFFDRPQTIESIPNDDPQGSKVALELAKAGAILLKNQDNILPLITSKIKRIALIGPNADIYNTGGGSSRTTPFHSISCFEGLKQLANGVEVNYKMGIPSLNYLAAKSVFYDKAGSATMGLQAEYFDNKELSGIPKATRIEKIVDNEWVQTPSVPGIGQDNFSVRWTGVVRPEKSATYKFTVKADDGYRLWLDNKLVVDLWGDHGPIAKSAMIRLDAGKEYSIRLEYYEASGDASVSLAWYEPQDENFDDAIKLAAGSDVAVVCVGFNRQTEAEGADRPFELPDVQDSLIHVVARANPNTVVILNAGSNVYMEKWLPKVKGLIHAFYPGQEGGQALAEILLGLTNPSGKLPISCEKKWADNPTFNSYYDPDGDKRVQYTEGLMVGYRYYDTKKVEPLFPFGFGMSYTTFAYTNIKTDLKQNNGKIKATVSFDVTNTGKYDGAEVSQLYVSDLSCPVVRPLKELKGFAKVFLKKGETKRVTINLDESAFSYFKTEKNSFGFDKGSFELLVGSSSRDIRLKKTVTVK
jgi:beta-glucosidase